MKSINEEHTKHLESVGFSATFSGGSYTFAHKTAREGILLNKIDDEYIIENFAFINGEQVIGQAASSVIVQGIDYLEDVLGISGTAPTAQMVGPHAEIGDGRAADTSLITERDFELQTTSRSSLLMMQKTDLAYIKERKGPGKSILKYVDVQYMIRALNFAFGFDWSFDVIETRQEGDYLTVLGKLTVNMDGTIISKTQWGSQQLRAKMELGDGLKGATSDSLKKCASMFGIAADVYSCEV